MFRTIGILIVASIASSIAGGVQQPLSPSDAQRRQDVYAIYSTMMSNPPSNFRNNGNSVVAITATTNPAMSYVSIPHPCIVPPPQYASRWTEVLADFNARKDTPATLERDLKISKPYVYLNPDEVTRFVNSQRTTPSQPIAEPAIQDTKEVFTLSDVYFDKELTLALTGVSSWCGSLCSSSQWKIYEKASDRTWREVRPASNCFRNA